MTQIELGINNCFAVKRWPRATEWTEIVSSDLGLDVVQFSFDLLDPRAKQHLRRQLIDEVKDSCKDRNVRVHSTFTGLGIYSFNLLMDPREPARLDAMNLYQDMIDVSSLVGASATGGHVAAMSQRDYQDEELREERISHLIASLLKLAAKAAERRQDLLWEPMPIAREPPSTINEAKRLHERVNRDSKTKIDFCIDTGHQCPWRLLQKPRRHREDLDVYSWLRKLGPITPVIHLQQTDGKGDRHWPFTERYNKRGIIEPRRLVEAIEDSGAKKSFLALEIIHPFEAPEHAVLEDLKKSVHYVKDRI
jgi:sugar phosphate isomerase/epimerase